MISKELLSAVLNIENITHVVKKTRKLHMYNAGEHVGKSKNVVYGVCVANECGYTTYDINIYELAHKCKKWAFNKGYYLSSYYDSPLMHGCEVQRIASDPKLPLLLDIESESEPEAIFEACEWILNEL